MRHDLPRGLAGTADAMGRRAAAILGLPYAAWRRNVLFCESLRVLLAAQNRPALLAPGTPIWSRDTEGVWRVEAVADGSEKVWVRDHLEGVPSTVDPTEIALAVTWVGRGDHFVVHRAACRWQPGDAPDVSPDQWRHGLSTIGYPAELRPAKTGRKKVAAATQACDTPTSPEGSA